MLKQQPVRPAAAAMRFRQAATTKGGCMDRPDDLSRLPSGDYSRINELADRFEKLLQEAEANGTEVDLNSLLPRRGDPLRGAALNELIKIDMEFRCRRGLPYTLDHYLQRFPELGT